MRRRRAAYALIELLVVMTVLAVMFTLCAGLIHLLLKLDYSGRVAAEEAADLARLARDFRADAHASAPGPVEIGEGQMKLKLEGGRTVEYQARPLDILRTVKEADKVRRHETYRRPARASVRLHADPPFVVLTIDRPADGRDDSMYRDFSIEAELGKDRRMNPRPE